jgi:DNA-binding CsgD family transcriptional regulator
MSIPETAAVHESPPYGGDRLLERADELAAIDDALDGARAGAGSLVLVGGAPGIGKSALLAAARRSARAANLVVLSASGLELEREFPFGVTVRLFEPVLDALDRAHRARVFSGPAGAAAALFERHDAVAVSGGAERAHAVVHALRRLTVNLSATGSEPVGSPLAIVVDDAQWSDAGSLRFLSYLAADVATLPVAIIVAFRHGSAEAPSELRRGLATARQSRSLRLRPLSAGAIDRLVRGVYPDSAPEFVRACARATGGNPFYLHELLQSARADGLSATTAGASALQALAPESVVNSVLLRLAGLPDPAPVLASALSVLGDGATLRQAAALAGVDGEAAEAGADALAAAHILRPGEPLVFAHPLIATAVHSDMPALARSRAHRRAAELLEAEGAAVENVAAHLMVCRPDSDPRVVDTLRSAAARAFGRGEPEGARRLLERALAEPPAPELRPQLLVDRALAEASVGTPAAVGHVRAALETVTDLGQRVDALRSLARLLFARSEFAAAAAACEQALLQLEAGDPRAEALLVDWLAIASTGAAPPPAAASGRLGAMLAGADAGRLPSQPGLIAQLAAAMLANGRPAAEVASTARTALAELPIDDGFYGIINGFAVVALLAAGDLEPAAARIEAVQERAQATGSLIASGMASHWLAVLRYYRGDLDGAIAAAKHTLEVARAGWDVCTGWVAPVLAHAHMDRMDLAAAADAVGLGDQLPAGRRERALCGAARGRLAHLGGDPVAAERELLEVGPLIERDAIGRMMVVPWRSSAALAAEAAGHHDRACSLAGAELTEARAGAPRTLGIALRVSGVTRGGRPGLELLREAVEVLASTPAALEHARALVALGGALRRAGQPVDSREPLRGGFELARALGAHPLADHAQHELRAAGGRRTRPRNGLGPTALTAAERRVAELAASGATTPEIARALYVTPKTVDWHLGHAYQKLGISSRRQLPGALRSTSDSESLI